MNRRDFITGSLGFGATTCLAGTDSTAADKGHVRFLAFADIHFESTGRWPHPEREWLDRILQRAVDAKVDFIISLGDMTFGPVTDAERDYGATTGSDPKERQQGLTPSSVTTGSDPSDNTLTEKPGTCRFATSIAAQIE